MKEGNEMMNWNHNKIVAVAVGAVAVGVLVLGFGADAKSTFARYVGRCANNPDFYERHMAWCERAYTVAPRMARQARQEPAGAFPPVQAYGDHVTVYRDHHAADDGGHVPDKFVAIQTTQDVARSAFFGLALGWFPGALNLGQNTIVTGPPVAQARAPRVTTTYYVKKVVATNQ